MNKIRQISSSDAISSKSKLNGEKEIKFIPFFRTIKNFSALGINLEDTILKGEIC
jgi:hypothetical protein